MDRKHGIVTELKRLAAELGHPPSCDEVRLHSLISIDQIIKEFGLVSEAFKAAGLQSDKRAKWKYKPARIESIQINEYSLEELFKRAGNPEVLKMIFEPDTHIEHVDRLAFACFLDYISWYQPDVFMIGGDFLNASGLSHWGPEDLQPQRIVPELIKGRNALKAISDLTQKASTRIFLEGNHEDWINQAMMGMPQLFDGLDELGIDLSLNSLLELEKHGYDLHKVNTFVKIGDAHFTHGIYSCDNHAKKHLDKLKANIYYGHLHDGKSWHDTSLSGTVEAMSLFCLCRLDAKFLKGKPNNWGHGFGQFEFFRDGSYSRIAHRIENGRLSVNGRMFRA